MINSPVDFSKFFSYYTNRMKKKTHPKYFKEATVECACGSKFTVGSTQEHTDIEICSQCHPFYTGQEKIVDTLGQVERFKKRQAKHEQMKKNE